MPDKDAMEHSQEHFVQAMNHFLTASTYRPTDLMILGNIATCAKRAGWVSWSNVVYTRIKRLELLLAKEQAERRLPYLRQTLQSMHSLLASLRKDRGLFVGIKIKDTETKIQKLKAEIAEQERIAAYKLPDA